MTKYCADVMTVNTELEERWIDAWNKLFDIVGERRQFDCLLPDGSIADLETCKGWLQDSAYQGYLLKVEAAWVKGKQGVVVSRFNQKQ
jgi:hypothetical protein